MSDTHTIEMIPSTHPDFSWDAFHALMQMPEIYNPQMEDGLPPPEEMNFRCGHLPGRTSWLVKEADWYFGYTAVEQMNFRWVSLHTAFRRGTPGFLKKAAVMWTMGRMFECGAIKITAMIPRFNRPACHLAGAVGMQREGVITKAFLRNGQLVDLLVFGVEKDVFPVR